LIAAKSTFAAQLSLPPASFIDAVAAIRQEVLLT
jgi:hypothetical protein